MDSIRRFLQRLSQGSYTKEYFDAGITLVQENLADGLPDDTFKSIVKIIIDQNLKKAVDITNLIQCLVPEGKIENQIMNKIICWILTYYDKKPASIITAILRWVVGVVEFGLANKSYVSGYYELFYPLIFCGKLERVVCHLLFLLTRPEDIYRGRVLNILSVHERNGKAMHTMALLSLFKSYKPECVPEKVQIRNIHRAFNTIKPSMENNLRRAQKRVHAQGDGSSGNNEQYSWSRLYVKQEHRLIPEAAYIHLGSTLYQEKRKKIMQCLDKGTLMSSQHCIEIPSRVLTLLMNEGGIHFLATHNPAVHVRFSYVVYYTLRTALTERRGNIPQQECEYFLKQLVDLEDYMQQGIPVVSRFLSEYMCTWDGSEYRQYIYRLLERFTFKTFSELEDYVLDFLNTLFITGSVEEKCLIIRTLQRLIMNLVTPNRSEADVVNGNGTAFLFLGANSLAYMDVSIVIPGLISAVGKLCTRGLQITSGHPLLLHTCIVFYETVAEIELGNKSWSILPRACVYRCLLGSSVSALSRTCDVLLKYTTQTYSEIKAKTKGDRGFSAIQISMITEYSCDIYNCLVKDKALSKAYQGYIFENLTDVQKAKFYNCDAAFSITSSVAMNAFLVYMKRSEDDISLENTLLLFRVGFTGLCKFLDFLAGKVEGSAAYEKH